MAGRPDRGLVQLLVTCIVHVFYPAIGRAIVRILEGLSSSTYGRYARRT